MKPRTTARLYWILTLPFCLLMLADGIAGLLHEQNGVAAIKQLGYPVYLLDITGAAKILGALALLQPKYRTLQEWAYAGFANDFVGAGASVLFAGMGLMATIPALVMLILLLGLHWLWKRLVASRSQSAAAFASPAVATLY
jgi:hypothetical protein